jgi:glycosyltransferase involved in cell wall biosynthesis
MANIVKHPVIALLADFPWSFLEEGAKGRGAGQQSTWLSQLADQYAKGNACEMHWISIDRDKNAKKYEKIQWGGQQFHKFKGNRLRTDLMLNCLPSRRLLMRFLRDLNPSLLHCWGTETTYPSILRNSHIPGILSMQGILSEYRRIGGLPRTWIWDRLATLEPTYLNHADIVTCESQWGMDMVRNAAPEAEIRKVEYGVNPSFYDLTWKPDSENPFALYSGSIDYRKGLDVLLDSLDSIPGRNWTLKIAGDGPMRPELEGRGLARVEWLGLLRWNELQSQLCQATCLVLPTRADTSPNVAKEARVVGLPVITTRHGGQSGYIMHGRNGLIVDPLDAANLAEALQSTMTKPDLARTLGACNHDHDREYFRPEHTADGFLKLYDELLERALAR